MKRIMLITLVFILTATVYGQPEQISVNYENTPFVKVLDELAHKTGVRFAYSVNTVKDTKPVSLKRTGSFERVTMELFRERGLEGVMTAENMMTLVPSESIEGLYKAQGRACRIFVKLEAKLERAVLEKDIVRIPGWTDDDDRDLGFALMDFFTVLVYLHDINRSSRVGSEKLGEQYMRLAQSFDPDVRVGVALQYVFSRVRFKDEVKKKLLDIGLSDGDPIVRGMWLMAFAEFSPGKELRKRIYKETVNAAESKNPALRFAAVVSCIAAGGNPEADNIAEKLQSDSNAAVRIMASFQPLFLRRNKKEITPEFTNKLNMMLKDTNPIVRSFGLFLEITFNSRNPVAIVAFLGNLSTSEDPWLKKMVKTFSPFVSFMMKQPPDFSYGEELLFSDHRSDQLMGAGFLTIAFGFLSGNNVSKSLTIPSFEKYLSLLDSDSIWLRLFGMQAAAIMPHLASEKKLGVTFEMGMKGRQKLIEGLKSDDIISRYTAVLGSFLVSDFRKNSVPGLPKFLKPLVNDPDFCIRSWGGMALVRTMPFEQQVDVMIPIIKEKKNMAMIYTFISMQTWGRRAENKEEAKKKMEELVPVILNTGDRALISHFINEMSWNQDFSEEILSLISKHGNIAVLEAVLKPNSIMIQRLRNEKSSMIIHSKCKALFEKADSKEKLRILDLYAGFLKDNYGFQKYAYNNLKEKDRVFVLDVELFIEQLLKFAFTNGGKAEGTHLLNVLSDPNSPFVLAGISKQAGGGIPLFIQNYLPNALSLVLDSDCGNEAVELLGRFTGTFTAGQIKWKIAEYPELREAVESAVNIVLEDTSLDRKIPLLLDLANGGDERAATTLSGLIVEDKIPDNQFASLFKSVFVKGRNVNTWTETKKVIDYFLWAINEKEVNSEKYTVSFDQLSRRADYRTEFIEACKIALKRKDYSSVTIGLYNALHSDPYTPKGEGVRPAWFDDALTILRTVEKEGSRDNTVRMYHFKCYCLAAGEVERGELEGLILDGSSDLNKRVIAAENLFRYSPQTKVYIKMLENYSSLDNSLKTALGKSVVRSPEADKSAEFFLKLMDDAEYMKTQSFYVSDMIRNLNFPWSKEMEKTLQKLKKNPGLKWEIKRALKKLEKEKPVL